MNATEYAQTMSAERIAIARKVYMFTYDQFATDRNEIRSEFGDDGVNAMLDLNMLSLASEESVTDLGSGKRSRVFQTWLSPDEFSREDAAAEFDKTVKVEPEPEFNRDAIAEALATINSAVAAIREAAAAACVVGEAGRNFSVEPLANVQRAYVGVVQSPSFAELESLADIAAVYYPTASRA